MSDRAVQAFREGAFLSDEVQEPSRPSDAERSPGPTPDLASLAAAEEPAPVEDLGLDLTIGLGEDPGWVRRRQEASPESPGRRMWHGAGTRKDARQGRGR